MKPGILGRVAGGPPPASPPRGPLILALLLVVANRLAALALPTASRYVVDEVIGRQRIDRLGLIALLASAALAIETAAAFGAMQLAGVAGQRAIAALRQELQERVVGLPLRRLDVTPAVAGGQGHDRLGAGPLPGRQRIGALVASMLTASLALGSSSGSTLR